MAILHSNRWVNLGLAWTRPGLTHFPSLSCSYRIPLQEDRHSNLVPRVAILPHQVASRWAIPLHRLRLPLHVVDTPREVQVVVAVTNEPCHRPKEAV